MDILAEVVHPVGPHDEGHLHDGNDQNRDTGPIRVHDVQYILASLQRLRLQLQMFSSIAPGAPG